LAAIVLFGIAEPTYSSASTLHPASTT